MKCVSLVNDLNSVQRVSDERAYKLVNEDDWRYVPKHIWKNVRVGRKVIYNGPIDGLQ